MALLAAAFTIFVLCLKRLCRHRPPLENSGDSVDLPRLPQEKPVAESFPVFVYESENYSERGFECAVCLCEFEEREKGRTLPACKHSFHVDCIDKWLNSHSTCPICRATTGVDRPLSQ
ncbi:hypothetical protein SUGI_0112380 [Cryptomeria japonica]|nr:hypothetical protein SUGI_0112380 [Cryptomeria japonica]